MKEELEIVNNYLNEYLKNTQKSFFSQNLPAMYNLSVETIKSINKTGVKNIEPLTIYLPLFTSIEIAKAFLETVHPKYSELFEEQLKNGTISFSDATSTELDPPEPSRVMIGNHLDLNVCIQNNYKDPATLVHEFFHTINLNDSPSHQALTEAVSIFLEHKCLDYMKEQGYNEQEIEKVRLKRNLSTYFSAKELVLYLPWYLIFDTLGNVTEDTFEYCESHQIFTFWKSKQEFKEELHQLCNKLNYQKETDSYHTASNINYTGRYVFCNNLCNYLRVHETPQTIAQVLVLNEQLNNKTSVNYALRTVGVNLDSKNINAQLIAATTKTVQDSLIVLQTKPEKKR